MVILAIDFDSTLVEWDSNKPGEWLPGAREALDSFLNQGFEIIIHSCRPLWYDGAYEEMRTLFDEYGYEDVKIWNDRGKPFADFYIDDRALMFTTWEDTYHEVIVTLLSRETQL